MSRSSTASRSCVFDCKRKASELASEDGGDRLEDIDERPCTVHWYCKLVWSDRGRGKYNGLSTGSGERHGLEKVAYRSALYANAGKDRRTHYSDFAVSSATVHTYNTQQTRHLCRVPCLSSAIFHALNNDRE